MNWNPIVDCVDRYSWAMSSLSTPQYVCTIHSLFKSHFPADFELLRIMNSNFEICTMQNMIWGMKKKSGFKELFCFLRFYNKLVRVRVQVQISCLHIYNKMTWLWIELNKIKSEKCYECTSTQDFLFQRRKKRRNTKIFCVL